MTATGWICPRCGASNAPHVSACGCKPASGLRDRLNRDDVVRWPERTATFDPSKCPCNPALGGSGICGCIMAGPQVIC